MVTVPVRHLDLVLPLAHEATDTRITETSGLVTQDRSGAVTSLIGASLRRGDVDSTTRRSTLATQIMPGIRISTMAICLTSADPLGYSARTATHLQSGLVSRKEGGQAASNAAIFMFVNNATLLGGGVGRFGAPVPSSGRPTRIAALPDWSRDERLNKPRRSLAMCIVTSSKKFFKVNHQGDTLFQVSPDIPIQDALEQASCFLESSYAVFSNNLEPSDMDFAAAHLIEMAKALVDSVTASLAKEKPHV